MSKKGRVVVAMSGGVDSSVAAALLVEQGYDVVGISMRLHETPPVTPEGKAAGCCSLDDFLDARKTASLLGIPYYVIDFAEEFEKTVLSAFVSEYKAGRTPIPCAICNERVKFDALIRRAMGIGADRVATGHYVRIKQGPEGPQLLAGVDPIKDQSYFLFGTPKEMLEKLLFPVGGLTKPQVREIAHRWNLPVADKSESQELCFVPDGNVAKAVEKLGGVTPAAGKIVNRRGESLGRHPGVHHYTVGQRRGIQVPSQEKLYVLQIDAPKDEVVVGTADELYGKELVATDVNWLGSAAVEGQRALVRIRHRNAATQATLWPEGDDRVRVTFDEPKQAIAPGQAAVFYDGSRVLGGGWIA